MKSIIPKLSSKNKKIVLFSDMHENVDAAMAILNQEKDADHFVFLGDFFDSPKTEWETESVVCKTLLFLKSFIDNERNFSIVGNHDIHYITYREDLECSGFNETAKYLISDFANNHYGTKQNLFDKFFWGIMVDDFFCSHAGLNEQFVKAPLDLGKFEEILRKANSCLFNNEYHWLFNAGKSRGGRQEFGGIIWQDYYFDFFPIDGIKQIFGHTHGDNVRTNWKTKLFENPKETFNAKDICIDSGMEEYIVITNGEVEVKKVKLVKSKRQN